MNHIEKIARHLCVRAGYDADLAVNRYPGQFATITGPFGHIACPYRCQAWELYAPIVREVLFVAALKTWRETGRSAE